MKSLLFTVIFSLILISCSKNNSSTPSNQVNKDYLSFYYKQATDSTYLNYRLIFTDTIPAGSTVYPRVYTKNVLNGDTIFVCILNKLLDTIYAETSVGYVGYQLDMVPIKPKSTQPMHGYAYYLRNSSKVLIYDTYFIMR